MFVSFFRSNTLQIYKIYSIFVCSNRQQTTKTYNYIVISGFTFDAENFTDNDILAYATTNITTEQQFNEFKQSITILSNITSGIKAEYGDRFLTLFTCSTQNLRYRVVIVAKLVEIINN